MRLNRRNILIAIAITAMASGAVLGSGAFTSVEADRTLNLQTANDSNAYLELTGQSPLVGTETGTNSQTILAIDLNNLNDDATTTLDPAFNITNTLGSDVGVGINNVPAGVTLQTGGGTDLSSNTVTLAAGNSMEVELIVDTTSSVSASTTITIVADTSTA